MYEKTNMHQIGKIGEKYKLNKNTVVHNGDNKYR